LLLFSLFLRSATGIASRAINCAIGIANRAINVLVLMHISVLGFM